MDRYSAAEEECNDIVKVVIYVLAYQQQRHAQLYSSCLLLSTPQQQQKRLHGIYTCGNRMLVCQHHRRIERKDCNIVSPTTNLNVLILRSLDPKLQSDGGCCTSQSDDPSCSLVTLQWASDSSLLVRQSKTSSRQMGWVNYSPKWITVLGNCCHQEQGCQTNPMRLAYHRFVYTGCRTQKFWFNNRRTLRCRTVC